MFDIFSTYGFLEEALLAGVLAGILCGVIGSYIVVRKSVFISAGIGHISFGGLGIAYYLSYPPFIGALVFASLSAFGLSLVSQSKQQDAAIGILWAMGMAVGILFIHLTPGYAPDLMSYLFGNILIVSTYDLYRMLTLSFVVVLFFVLFYNEILAFTFDRDFAFVKGIKVKFLNIALYILMAFSIVSLIEFVGIILVMALLTIPPSIAMIFSLSFRAIIFVSICISIFFVLLGLVLSYYTGIPSGVLITLPQGVLLLLLKFAKYKKLYPF